MKKVEILDTCLKEIHKFPKDVIKDILDVVVRMQSGESLGMPLSRSMSSIGKSVFELRIKDKTGAYRVIYFNLNKKGEIYLLHAFKKKTQKTPKKNLDLAARRLRSL
jgi:phage-related protein